MLTLSAGSAEQKVNQLGKWKIGGQPGNNPPLLVASMFHNGDRILESRKERKFDRDKATEYIKKMEELSDQTGVPALVALVANSAGEMKEYVDFYTSISDRPFGIDMWVQKPRLEAAGYCCQKGLADRLVYNSITPWDKDIPGQVAQLKEMGIKHVVLQAYNEEDPSPKGRVTGLKKMLEEIGEKSFDSIMVDTSVMNLPSTSFSCIASKMVKEEFGYPSGVASSNGTYMWKEAREMWGSDGFTAMNATAQGMAAFFWSDVLFTGPIVNVTKIIPAVATACLLQATMAHHETGKTPDNENHPLYKFYPDFAKQLSG